MNDAQVNSKRRTFLTAAACAPVIVVGALLARQRQIGAELAVPSVADDAPESLGYHETEHIRKYYRSAAYL